MATITVKGTNCTSFSGGTEQASTSCVGTTWDGNTIQTVVCRYKFTTDAYGATSFTFKTTRGYCDVRGSSSSDDQIGRMRFAIGTSATQYKTTKSSSVGTAITDYRYGGSGTGYVAGSSSTKLLPNTTYYLWVFPNANFASYVRFGIGNCTITTSGTYGTVSTISANNGTFGSGIPVTLTNAVSGTTNILKVSCGGITKTLINNTKTMSATWTPSLSEYGPAITNAKSATATFTVTTYYNGAQWGGTNSKTITVSFNSGDVSPSISEAAIEYDNEGTAASAITLFVQGYSKAKATITASGQYGATISTYALTINGATVSSDSDVQTSATVTTSGTVTATIKVTDSRGFTATTTQDFTVQPYSNPSLTGVDLHRSNSSGTAAEDGEFLYAYGIGNISSLSGQNTLTMSVAFKTTTGSYGTETPMTSGTAVVVSGLDPDVTYVARITLTDRLGNSSTATNTIRSQKWAMKFNSDATAVGFGKAPEADKVLEIPHDWSLTRKDQAGTATAHAVFTDELSALLLERIYPVGSLYMSTSAASPQSFLGGTWQRITGRFLLCATDGGSSGASQAAGRTGGEAAHTLTADELPAHTHTIPYTTYATATTGTNRRFAAYAGSTVSTGSAGGDVAHNNMPPYLAVYVWERTA